MHRFFRNPMYMSGFPEYPMQDPQSNSSNRKKQVVGSPKSKKPNETNLLDNEKLRPFREKIMGSVLEKVKRLSGDDESSEYDDESSESDEEGMNLMRMRKQHLLRTRILRRIILEYATLAQNAVLDIKKKGMCYGTSSLIRLHATFDSKEEIKIVLGRKALEEGFKLDTQDQTLKGCTMYLAVAMDGNNQILPLAYGVGKSERFTYWDWFLMKLKECIIACKAYQISNFEERFSTLRDWLPSVANKLDMIGLEKWARVYFLEWEKPDGLITVLPPVMDKHPPGRLHNRDRFRSKGEITTPKSHFEADYPAIVYDDALTSNENVSSKPTDFNKKFYNSLGRVPNHCSSSIGKRQWLLLFCKGIGKITVVTLVEEQMSPWKGLTKIVLLGLKSVLLTSRLVGLTKIVLLELKSVLLTSRLVEQDELPSSIELDSRARLDGGRIGRGPVSGFFGVSVTKLATGQLIDALSCDRIDMVIKDLDLDLKDIVAKFCGPSRWKELSKEMSSKILPCGDGSCWKTSSESTSFMKSLRCWFGSSNRSPWNEHPFFTNQMVSDRRDMNLPPRDQRHQYLRFEGLEYSDTDIVDFRERLEKIYSRGSTGMLWVRVYSLAMLGGDYLRLEANWLCEAVLDLKTVGPLQFQLGRAKCRMYRREFILDIGLHTTEEIESAGFRTGMDVGLVNIPYLLARYLRRFSLGRKRRAMISEEPERQPDVTADASELAEGAPDVDEDPQAVPEPVQAPQPSPVAAPVVRTMP
nr:hypothetical protein [Tanacetum cinerariifolium]